ncbi:MAG: Rrf2 family transcriptional regulator [Nitrospirae bacterium]|nr:Rrf2 family transcriptional regulator [Nitrospirota bacterium]
MFVTREADYAIRCVLHMARQGGEVTSIGGICDAMLVPRSFVAKILQRLSRAGIVRSIRGVKGGFLLVKPAAEINLLEVIEAIQGKSAANICAIDRSACSLSGHCAIHPIWVKLRYMVEEELKKQTFDVLSKRGPL